MLWVIKAQISSCLLNGELSDKEDVVETCVLEVFSFSWWTLFRVFNEFVTILLLFYIFWFFGQEACGILVS